MDLLSRPVIVRVILYLFEVAHSDSSGIREDIGDDRDSPPEEDRISLRSRRTIRELEDEFSFDLFCILSGNLILECGWNEDITVSREEFRIRHLFSSGV
jgi:hypothetical protein